MIKFGIVGEGVTDQITIKNILCGFFENPDLDDEIDYLPSNKKGGWRAILKYLTLEDFRNDILNTQFVILQIDTDISKRPEDAEEFGVFYKDEYGNELVIEELIAKITAKLVNNINTGELGFYEQYANKIIFAISVHSTECWLVAAHIPEQITIHDCDKVLLTAKIPNNIQFSKKQRSKCHEKLSQAFLEPDKIQIVSQKSPSFNLFIQQLQNISL
jgi:hypothetical protein